MSWTPETGVYMDSHYNLVYPKGATHLDGVDKAQLRFELHLSVHLYTN